jgi:polyphosphate glucokinase
MELGDLAFRKGRTFADYMGKAGRKRLGRRRWSRHVEEAVSQLQAALRPEYTVIGGGAATEALRLPPGVVRGHNNRAFIGGFRLWDQSLLNRTTQKAKAR